MMMFSVALTKLVYGKKIRRSVWPKGVFLESNGDVIRMKNGEMELKRYCYEDRVFSFADVCEDDWEIC